MNKISFNLCDDDGRPTQIFHSRYLDWQTSILLFDITAEKKKMKDPITVNIPLNTPICLKAHTGNNLQNEFGWRRGCCKNQNTEAWEQMLLLPTPDNKIIIQSRWNGRNLQVQESGLCVFANHNQELWEKFDVECDENGKVYFISCHTEKYMQCENNGFAVCANKNRGGWEAWTIVYPHTTSMMTSSQLRVISLSATGAVLFPVLGLAAEALVPLAMSTFGTVVPGVGTFHAPLVSGGCAAALQSASASLLTVEAAAVGSIAGAIVGAALSNSDEEKKAQEDIFHKKKCRTRITLSS